jgi:lysozyme family protein
MTRADCIAVLLKFEGGDSNNPADPGGATRAGITQRTLTALRQERAEFSTYPESVFDLTSEQIVTIYEDTDWAQIRGDELPDGLACIVLNVAVNEGEPTAVRMLQACAQTQQDGVLGPATLAALHAWRSAYMPEQSLAEEFCAHAAVRYAELYPREAGFELGWMRRLFRVYTLATQTAAGDNTDKSS